MTRPILQDLEPFHQWLMLSGKKASTATTYTSCVRKTLRAMGEKVGNPDLMEAYWDSIKPSTLSSRLTSWRAYCVYMRETFDIELPYPNDGRITTPDSGSPPAELDPEVCEAVRTIRDNGFPYMEMVTLLWGDVDLQDLLEETADFVHVIHPLDRAMSSLVPKKAIETLKEWGKPVNTESPLVPRQPGSSQPYPYRALGRQAKKGEMSMWDKAKLLREQAQRAAESGSALAAAEAFQPLDPLATRVPKDRDEGPPSIAHKYPSKFQRPSEGAAARLLDAWGQEEEEGAEAEAALPLSPRALPFSPPALPISTRASNDSTSNDSTSNDSSRPEGAGVPSGLHSGVSANGDKELFTRSTGSQLASRTASPPQAASPLQAPDPHLAMAAEMLKLGAPPAEVAAFVMEMRKLAKRPGAGPSAAALGAEAPEPPAPIYEPVVGKDGLLYDPNDPEVLP